MLLGAGNTRLAYPPRSMQWPSPIGIQNGHHQSSVRRRRLPMCG